jgi:hypothetical protein
MSVRSLPMLLVLAVASALGGCSMSGLLPNWTTPDVAGPEPPYRFLIANAIQPIVGDVAKAGTLKVTEARRVDSLKGASWLVCIQAQQFPLLPRYYAVFFQGGHMVDTRLSVLVDQCEIQTYTAFDAIAEASAPAPR